MKKYIAIFVLLFTASITYSAFANTTSNTNIAKVAVSKDYSSYSIEELEALIVKLQKQVEELKKGAQCFVSDKNLSLGDGDQDDSQEDVRRLQEFLREKGYFTAKKSTGYFGKITRLSLLNFQREIGIAQTGELDTTTRVKIQNLRCKVTRVEDKQKVKELAKEIKTLAVSSILLFGNGKTVTWKTGGYSKNGFKVIWSKNSGPTYPTRDGDQYQYFSSPEANSTTLPAFAGSDEYYVRVCEYLGGVCGVYSNEVILNL